MTASASEPWTTRGLLAWTTQHFTRHGIDHPRLAAEMLLGHVLGVPRMKLYTESDRPASADERASFRSLVERAAGHEPVDYLVGHSPFFTLAFTVNRDVLIPRPSTETLVEHVLQHARRAGSRPLRVADVGTGSGAIAVALARHLAACDVVATDVSEVALNVARVNADRHGVASRIVFRCGDLYTPLGNERFDYVVSNPPYIDDRAWEQVPTNVKAYEPHLALRAGADGLRFIRPIVCNAGRYLTEGGQLCVEIAATQEAVALALAAEAPALGSAEVLPDHERLPRVLVADMAAECEGDSAHHPPAAGESG